MELKNYSSFTKKEIVNAFCRLQQKIWLSIIIFILGITYIAYGIYTIINNDYKFIFLFAGIGFIAVSLALIVIPYFLALKANKDINGIDYELSFYDEFFDLKIKKENEIKESSIEYKNIYKTIRKGNIFYIYIDKLHAVLLKLSEFDESERIMFLELMKGIR